MQGAFSKDTPPAFDVHTSYAAYLQDVELWMNLTSLDPVKLGPAIVGRLSGEPKAAAKSIGTKLICGETGAALILEHLDKSYGVDAVDQLDNDLAAFLDYCWKRPMSIEEYIAGFHSRLDKLAELKINDKLKGHLLLRQCGLDPDTRRVIVGASAGNYDIGKISNSLRQAFRDTSALSSSYANTRGRRGRGRGRFGRGTRDQRPYRNNASYD